MAETQARIAYGTVIQFGDGMSPEGFTPVAEVVNITGPGMSREFPDATHMQSPGGWREFIGGLKDAGELTLDMNHLPGDPTQDASTGLLNFFATDNLRKNWQIVFPVSPPIIWEFNGVVSTFEPDFPIDDKMMLSVTIKISGEPLFLT